MAQSRLTLGLSVLLAIGSIIALDSCSMSRDQPARSPMKSSEAKEASVVVVARAACPGNGYGNPDPYGPIVCIDDTINGNTATLDPHPNPVHAVGVNKHNGNAPTVINWFTKSGKHDLVIKMKDANQNCIVVAPICHGPHCFALTDTNAPDDSVCKYSISLADRPDIPANDPDIHIDPCCP